MLETAADRIGRYEILAKQGEGTSGVVYKARDPQLDRVVAIKTLRADLGGCTEQHAELKKRFYQEATAAGRLNHPNIVAIHDVVEICGVPYIVMEHVEGRTLADIFAAEAPLASDRAVDLTRQVCRALEYAHAQGVVHRDIKPANILVAENGEAKVSDFGIARISGTKFTQTGAMLGSPAYMAPEQVRGDGADGRSDLFSLGVVLYEALTGSEPFHTDDLASLLYQIVHVEPVPVLQWNPAISPGLDAVVTRVMAKQPEGRYQDAREFADALARALEQPEASITTPKRAEGPRLRLTRGGRPAVVLGVACLLSLAVGSWALSGRSSLQPLKPESWDSGQTTKSPAAPGPTEQQASIEAVPLPNMTPAPERPTQGPSASAAPLVGSILIVTNPAVEVFLDGGFKGRTGTDPFVIPNVTVGQRLVLLRLGSREQKLRGTLRKGETLSLTYSFAQEHHEATREGRYDASPDEPVMPQAVTPNPTLACLSVNAVPFASVYVDGRHIGDTPKACLRVPVGEHRVHFEAGGERSPERVVQVTEQHTGEQALPLSYNFKSRQFVER